MDHWATVKRGAKCPVQTVFEVELVLPLHDMGEQIAVERRLLIQQGLKVKVSFGSYEVGESDLTWRQHGPVSKPTPVLGVGPLITNRLEDHVSSLGPYPCRARAQRRSLA